MKIVMYIDVTTRDIPSYTYLTGNVDGLIPSFLPLFKTAVDGRLTYKTQNKISPDIVITGSFNARRAPEIAIRSVLSNSILVEFTSEQYYSAQFIPEKIPLWNGDSLLKQDFYFVWSKYYAEQLIKYGKLPASRIFIIGSPKVDLAKTYLKLSPSKDKMKKILFMSDYKPADYSQKDCDNFERIYKIKIPFTEVEVVRKERVNAIHAANQLSKKYKVRFRIHPGEDFQVYQDMLSKDVELSLAETTLPEDIKNSDLVIGYTSTAIFEVLAMKKPYISLHEHKYPEFNKRQFLIQNKSLCVSTKDLINNIETYFNINPEIQKKMTFFCDNLQNGDSKSAFNAALLIVNEVGEKQKSVCKLSFLSLMYFYALNFTAWLLRKIISVEAFKKMLVKFFPVKLQNMTRPMNNYSLETLQSLSYKGNQAGEMDSQEETHSFQLGKSGWEYKEIE